MCQSFKASSKSAESKNFTFPGRCKRSPVSFPRSRRDVRCFCLTQPRVATLWAQKIRGGNLADWLSENKNDVFLNVTWNPWPISWYIQLSMIIQPKKKKKIHFPNFANARASISNLTTGVSFFTPLGAVNQWIALREKWQETSMCRGKIHDFL